MEQNDSGGVWMSGTSVAAAAARPERVKPDTALWVLTGALLGGVLFHTAPARAYRTHESNRDVGVAARHRQSTVTWDLHAPLGHPSLSAIEDAATTAYDTWSAPDCTSFRASFEGTTPSPAAPGDGRNTIEIVRSGWTERGFTAGRGATTDVQFVRTSDFGVPQAEITEADVYLNFEEFVFSTSGSPASGELDLLGVLVHEIGHQAIGLRHPCEREAAGEPLCEACLAPRILRQIFV